MRFVFRRRIVNLPQALPSFGIFQFVENLLLRLIVIAERIDQSVRFRRFDERRIREVSLTNLKEEDHRQTHRVPNENHGDVHGRADFIVTVLLRRENG